jgi:hypothetical protein
MLKKAIPVVLMIFCAVTAQAQLKFGFKTGLNFARMSGPSEMNDAGAELEKWENVTGFHIGATFAHHFSDNFGLRGELLYSKKGARYTFDGQSYRIFNYSGGSTLTNGNSIYRININNSYLDIPVVGFARFGDFELSAGVYAGLLLQSVGEGSLQYQGNTVPLGNPTGEIKFLLDHNYRRDDPGTGDAAQTVTAQVDARTLELPRTLGAYYDLPEDKGALFQTLDYGLVGGVSYYLSRSMYANARLQYGLADLTNNDADLSKARTDNGQLIFREDKDHNFAIQISIGFSF